MAAPTRPPLRYHGGKWSRAPWVAQHFPEHWTYVEPFGGGGSVLLRKTPAPNEIYNDLDGHVVNLFRVLRSPVLAEELCRVLRLTPYSSEEYDAAQAAHRGGPVASCPVERARQTVFYAAASYSGYMPGRHLQFRRITKPKDKPSNVAMRFQCLVDALPLITERLRSVVIECMDALELIELYDHKNTLFYCDPPYVHERRTGKDGYTHEMTLDQHQALLDRLLRVEGSVVLSGYDNELYNDTLTGWTRKTQKGCRTMGAYHRSNPDADNEVALKEEVLWLSPNIEDNQLNLFGDS